MPASAESNFPTAAHAETTASRMAEVIAWLPATSASVDDTCIHDVTAEVEVEQRHGKCGTTTALRREWEKS
jgi:hypothetical protein